MLLLVFFFEKIVLLLVFFFKKNVLLLVFFFVLSVSAFRLGMGLFYGKSVNPVNHSRLPHIEYKSFLDNIIIRGFGKL